MPNFVAERWHAACQQAMAGKVGDDEQQDLGTLHLQPAAESGQLKPAALSTRPAANLPQARTFDGHAGCAAAIVCIDVLRGR